MKAYWWQPDRDGDEGGVAVIADNGKEAMKLGRLWWERNIGLDGEFIEQRCRLLRGKDIQIDGLPKGTVS